MIVNTVLAIYGTSRAADERICAGFPITIGAGLLAMSLALPFTLGLFERI